MHNDIFSSRQSYCQKSNHSAPANPNSRTDTFISTTIIVLPERWWPATYITAMHTTHSGPSLSPHAQDHQVDICSLQGHIQTVFHTRERERERDSSLTMTAYRWSVQVCWGCAAGGGMRHEVCTCSWHAQWLTWEERHPAACAPPGLGGTGCRGWWPPPLSWFHCQGHPPEHHWTVGQGSHLILTQHSPNKGC